MRNIRDKKNTKFFSYLIVIVEIKSIEIDWENIKNKHIFIIYIYLYLII